ncbi:MAG TPA: DUF397 domain-containing protein [Actinoallomurus sp.]
MRLGEPDARRLPAAASWRKSSLSNPSGNCVELALVPAACRVPQPGPGDTEALPNARPDQ